MRPRQSCFHGSHLDVPEIVPDVGEKPVSINQNLGRRGGARSRKAADKHGLAALAALRFNIDEELRWRDDLSRGNGIST